MWSNVKLLCLCADVLVLADTHLSVCACFPAGVWGRCGGSDQLWFKLRAESAVAQSAAGNQTFCLFLQTNISQPGIKSDVTEVCSLNVYSSHLSIDYINWTWPLVAVCITTIDWMQQRQKGKFSNNKTTENKIGINTWQNNTRLFV